MKMVQHVSQAGMGGLVLRLRDDGHAALTVVGGPGTAAAMTALRNIVSSKYPALHTHEAHTRAPLYEVRGAGLARQQPTAVQDAHVDVVGVWSGTRWQAPQWLQQGTEGERGGKKRRLVDTDVHAPAAPRAGSALQQRVAAFLQHAQYTTSAQRVDDDVRQPVEGAPGSNDSNGNAATPDNQPALCGVVIYVRCLQRCIAVLQGDNHHPSWSSVTDALAAAPPRVLCCLYLTPDPPTRCARAYPCFWLATGAMPANAAWRMHDVGCSAASGTLQRLAAVDTALYGGGWGVDGQGSGEEEEGGGRPVALHLLHSLTVEADGPLTVDRSNWWEGNAGSWCVCVW